MLSRRYLDAQTQLVDGLLAELAHSQPVNFNNTKQLDTLLTHLEATLAPFVLVPSVPVLHIVLTLAARCPASNWTHDAALSEAIVAPSAYMQLVNAAYDAAVGKALLGARSGALLARYVALLAQGAVTVPLQNLHLRMERAVGAMMRCEPLQAFAKHKARVDDTADVEDAPVVGVAPVEVISDSEGSDSLLETAPPAQLVALYRPAALRTVTSLADLGSRTSGLGEAATLFRDMPHLLAQPTPEPEEPRKRRKAADPLAAIQVFDDALLAQKLARLDVYSVWTLLRWTFWCADTSAQYQQFLFNAGATSVHSIFAAYERTLRPVFRFVALQSRCRSASTSAPLDQRLLVLLGRKADWGDRAAEFVLTGLAVASNDRPYPCYLRERVLIKHDPVVQTSQCKTAVEYDDNLASMPLRLQVAGIVYCGVANSADFVAHLALKLARVPLRYLRGLFAAYAAERDTFALPPAELDAMMVQLACKMLADATDVPVPYRSLASDAEVAALAALVCSDRLYASVTEDCTFQSYDEFYAKWLTVLFLTEWLVAHAMDSTDGRLDSELTASALAAQQHMARLFSEFLLARSEDAEVLADDSFTLTAAQIAQYRLQCGQFGTMYSFATGDAVR